VQTKSLLLQRGHFLMDCPRLECAIDMSFIYDDCDSNNGGDCSDSNNSGDSGDSGDSNNGGDCGDSTNSGDSNNGGDCNNSNNSGDSTNSGVNNDDSNHNNDESDSGNSTNVGDCGDSNNSGNSGNSTNVGRIRLGSLGGHRTLTAQVSTHNRASLIRQQLRAQRESNAKSDWFTKSERSAPAQSPKFLGSQRMAKRVEHNLLVHTPKSPAARPVIGEVWIGDVLGMVSVVHIFKGITDDQSFDCQVVNHISLDGNPVLCMSRVKNSLNLNDSLWIGGFSEISIINTAKKTLLKSWNAHNNANVRQLLVVGRHVWSCGEDCCIRVWSADEGVLLRALEKHVAPVVAMCCLSTSTQVNVDLVCTGSKDGQLIVWDAKNQKLVSSIHTNITIQSIYYSSAVDQLFVSSEDGTISIFVIST